MGKKNFKFDKRLLDYLACPKCNKSLEYNEDYLICRECLLQYRIEGGLPVLLLSEAEKLDN